MRILLFLLLLSSLASISRAVAIEPQLMQGKARVVLVGDSITGLSRNYATGFAHQMDWALEQTYPGCKPSIVALGGSGQGVRSWLNIEMKSRSEATFLDVKGIEVKTALSQPADVLVIMLGMNDVLSPYVNDDPASIESWAAGYRELITNLQSRVHPKVTALGTATLCTEDVNSPKNRMIDKLNARAFQLGQEMHLSMLGTNVMMRNALALGRERKPDFHVTYDFVHPNEVGHIAVAMAMLGGLGEADAAQKLADERLPKALEKAAGPLPALSYAVEPLASVAGDEHQSFRVRYWLSQPAIKSVELSGDGWEVKATKDGEFSITGVPARRDNVLKLQGMAGGQLLSREVHVPAPWLVTAGLPRSFWNGQNQTYDAAKARGPLQEAIARNEDLAKLSGSQWQRYFASVNFTGGNAPGSVDFAAVTHAKTFEGGCAARWIYSDKDRAVNTELSVQAFAGNMHLAVSLNGAEVYAGVLTSEPKKHKVVEALLRKGWNVLVCDTSHMQWQWQFTAELQGIGGDSLEDLRYSAVPHHL